MSSGVGHEARVGQRQFDQIEVETLEIGAKHVAVCRVDGRRDNDPAPSAGARDRHQRALGERGRAVVHRGVGDVHAGQSRDQTLKLVDHLQGALGDLRLVRRVGGVELAAGQDLPDGRRDEVPVGSGAEIDVFCRAAPCSEPRTRASWSVASISVSTGGRSSSGKSNTLRNRR